MQLKEFFNKLPNEARLGIAIESHDRMSVEVDEKLLEIPSDVIGVMWLVEDHRVIFEVLLRRWHARFQIVVQRMLILAIDVDQPEQREIRKEILARSDVFQAVEKFVLGFCRLLVAELIARDAEYGEWMASGELVLQCIQLKILKRHASERRHVHDQTQLISVLGQRLLFQIEILQFKIVDRSRVLTRAASHEWHTIVSVLD